MEEIIYIKEFYLILIPFLLTGIILSTFSYVHKTTSLKLINIITVVFSIFTVYYIGLRDVEIGVDTYHYKFNFDDYAKMESFQIRKDFFFDFITYIFAKFSNFQSFLTFCAFIYVFASWYGLKLLFKSNYYLPYFLFLISPYFFQFGINVMRSGMSASIFLIGIARYHQKGANFKFISLIFLSLMFHLSMILPSLVFLLTAKVSNTKMIFFAWLASIFSALFGINFLSSIVSQLGIFSSRFSVYTVSEGDQSSWGNFLIFGAIPVLYGVYNVLILNYESTFYKKLINTYMLVHIPYIILINTEFALRIGYLAEFMMGIILFYPILINPILKMKFVRVKISIIILLVFLVKAYKILIV